MPKGDTFSNDGRNTGFGREKAHDFMRMEFQLEEFNRLNRAKADRNQEIRVQGLQSDFQRYYQQIENAIEHVIKILPEDAKKLFSNDLQGYEQLKKDFSDVISFTNSDQLATKPSDHFTPRLLELKRSVRDKYEARLKDAVNQIRPLSQKLIHQMLLAKSYEAAQLQDQLRRETTKSQGLEDKAAQLQDRLRQAIAKNRRFNQESKEQRSTIHEIAIKMNQDIKTLSEKYDQYLQLHLQMKDVFSKEADKTFTQIKEDIAAYNSIFENNASNFHQTKVSDLLKACATLNDKYRAISAGMEQLESIKNLQERSKTLEGSLRALERDIEQRQILERAKPVLSPEAEQAFFQLEKLHSQIKHNISIPDIDSQHREAFEKLLGYLSPETLEEFQQRNVKFVVDLNAKVFYPTVAKDNGGQLQIKIYMPYPYGIHGLMLRTIDLLLEVHQKQYQRIPTPLLRAEVAARAFHANERMGKEGFHRTGYEMAEIYYNDYEFGIIEALSEKIIDANSPKEVLEEIGYKYALQEYIKRAEPKGDIPVFPGMQPGAYFEESGEWELNEGQRPVEVESEAFDRLMKTLDARRKQGDNFTLTVNILPPEDTNSSDTPNKILVQPFYTLEGLRSHHPINAGGKHTLWAGEIDIDYETKTVLRIKDQSGHFRTFDQDRPNLMIDYALNEFNLRGYDTSKTDKQLTFIVGAKEVSYRNYRPLIDPGQNMEALAKSTKEQVLKGEAPEDPSLPQWMLQINVDTYPGQSMEAREQATAGQEHQGGALKDLLLPQLDSDINPGQNMEARAGQVRKEETLEDLLLPPLHSDEED